MRRWIFGLSAVVTTTALVMACSVGSDCDFGLCAGPAVVGPGGEGGLETGADVLDSSFDAPLDPCVNTPMDPKCLTETTALFVSANAAAAGADGSRAHPFKTIMAGLAAANASRNRVYVCQGDYLENVTIQKTVSLLGGLTCDWMAKGANPRIAPTKGIALSIVKGDGVVVTDTNVEGSADAMHDGDSAVAVFVSESKAVLLRRLSAKAGVGTKGAPGADGDTTPNYTGPIATMGTSTSTAAGAGAPNCGTCSDGSFSIGGAGGTAGGAGPVTGSATPAVGTDNSGGTVAGSCVAGKPGAAGAAGGPAAAALAPGTLTATGWDSSLSAKKGSNGNPAQGGGGAGSNTAPALGGGAGGCGGCGGTGGGAGGNGGSSFAVLSFKSELSIEDSTLSADAGGTGGKGGKGQDGQFRGSAGGGACNGGDGGHGAGGGGGGGGASGHSAAIAYLGSAPTPTNSMLKHAAESASGDGGGGGASTGNSGKPGDNGPKGSAVDILPL